MWVVSAVISTSTETDSEEDFLLPPVSRMFECGNTAITTDDNRAVDRRFVLFQEPDPEEELTLTGPCLVV